MKSKGPRPPNIDNYIAEFPPDVQMILAQIRQTVSTAAPDAEECISYGMPAIKLNGVLVYFAAFKNHIGVYPPVFGDKGLNKSLLPYRGGKGNLRFSLDQPIPFKLITKIVKLRVKQNRSKAGGKR